MSGNRISGRTGPPQPVWPSGCEAERIPAPKRWRPLQRSSRRFGDPMAEGALTLRDFLVARTDDAREAIEQSAAGTKLKEAVGKLPGIEWGPVSKEIEAKIGESLDVDIIGIPLGGRKNY